ncbi:MAG: IS1595 family transposase [Clostridia bacterium]|nr:IS1595 family transposase [Clostridia bacterium]
MKKKLDKIIDLAEKLSNKERSAIIDKILEMLGTAAPKDSCASLITEYGEKIIECPHCQAKANLGYVAKKGFAANGAQRYICKKCGRTFVPTTNTAFARSRKSPEVWKKFIRLTLGGKSIQECAEECGLACQTAFTWRHKVLNVFAENQKSTNMSGVVEIDEMFIPISYKGNHLAGGFTGRTFVEGMDNGLPRASYKRGSDNKSNAHNSKACVFCMADNANKGFYAAVPGIGAITPKMLDATVGKHVNKEETIMLADQCKVTNKYLENNGYNHKSLASNVTDNQNDHKPEIDGEHHLQHVNSMHRHIRRFLANYCGVSTKYLENYLALFVWLKSVKATTKQRKGVDKASISRAATPGCYIPRYAIESRPMLPMCA